jgi:hypothetical protein
LIVDTEPIVLSDLSLDDKLGFSRLVGVELREEDCKFQYTI